MRNFNKRCGAWLAAAALFMGTATAAQAQTIWGAGAPDASLDSIGRFMGLSTSANQIHGWTATGFTTIPGGVANWESTTNTNSSYADFQGTDYDLVSPSAADGMAFFNSDSYYSTYNIFPQHAQLTSGTFSLAGYENTPLVLKFHTSIYEFQSDTLSVAISTDNGATWNHIDLLTHLNVGVNESYNGEVAVNISAYTNTVTDLSQCKVRFTFNGDSYFWAIDDVSIGVLPDYDITISGQTDGTLISDYFTTARVSNSIYVPFNQLSENEFVMGVRAFNQGALDIPVALNPRFDLTIEKEDANGDWILESTQTLPFDTIIPANGRVYAAEYLADVANPWMPTAEGSYRATYEVKHDGTDGSSAQDTYVQYFAVTPANTVYSKVNLDANLAPISRVSYNPAGLADATTAVTKFEWGSMFYFPNGAQTALESVSFAVSAPSATTTAPGFTTGSLAVRVYKYTANPNTGTLDTDPLTSGQLLLVGLGTTNVSATTTGRQTATATILDVVTEEALKLENETIYLVTVIQDNNNGLSVNTNGTNLSRAFSVGAETGLEYGFNMAFMEAMPSVLSITEKVGTGTPNTTWYGNGFGPSTMPSLVLNLADATIAVDKTENVNNLSLFPNPTADVLNVSVDLEKASDVQYIITDIAGRVVRMNATANVQNETVTFNVADLAAGVYTITVKSDKGISTEKFVKQ